MPCRWAGDFRRSEGILLVGPGRRRGEGAVLAGQGDGRRPRERARAGGRSVPDRGHGARRPIRQRRLRRTPISSRATEESPDWSRRWPESGPLVRAASSTSRRATRSTSSPIGWSPRCSRATAGPKSATTRGVASACGRSKARSRTRSTRLELKPGEPVADLRRSPRHHRPGRRRAGTALAADALDRRHDALARATPSPPTRWA